MKIIDGCFPSLQKLYSVHDTSFSLKLTHARTGWWVTRDNKQLNRVPSLWVIGRSDLSNLKQPRQFCFTLPSILCTSRLDRHTPCLVYLNKQTWMLYLECLEMSYIYKWICKLDYYEEYLALSAWSHGYVGKRTSPGAPGLETESHSMVLSAWVPQKADPEGLFSGGQSRGARVKKGSEVGKWTF